MRARAVSLSLSVRATACLLVLSSFACSQGGGSGRSEGGAGSGGGSAGSSGNAASLGGAASSGTAGATNVGGAGSSGGANGGGAGASNAAGFAGAAGAGGAAGSGGTTSASGGSAGSSGAINAGGASEAGGGATDTVDASNMAAQMGFGANIGNTLDNTTAWETGWGEPLISQAYINGMASRGIKTVRVPVAWDTYAINGVIDATKLNRVKEVVGWIEAAGMYPIVNIHWDGGWIDNESNANKYKLTSDVISKFASYWTQIATGFSGVDNKLIFEGLNEEGKFYVNGDTSQAPDYAALNQLNQLFVTTVRAQSGFNKTRALLIAGFTTDIDLTCVDAFTVPTDPAGAGKLFLSIHYYTPYTFTGLDTVESWGSPATTWGTDAEKATLQSLFSKLATFSGQKKIPVIIGEFGVTLGVNYVRTSAARTLWMESVAKAALSRGMVPVLWDTGSDIKRTDGSFSTELQAVIAATK